MIGHSRDAKGWKEDASVPAAPGQGALRLANWAILSEKSGFGYAGVRNIWIFSKPDGKYGMGRPKSACKEVHHSGSKHWISLWDALIDCLTRPPPH